MLPVNRRTQTLLVGAVPIVALAGVLSLPVLTVPYAAQGPGPVFDVLSDVEGKNIISVSGSGVDSERSKGELDMTTVAVQHNLSLPQALGLWMDPDNDIVPIEAIFPPGQSQDEVEEANKAAFTESEANATTAAFSHLGLPTEVTVAYTVPGSPADGRVHENDVIAAVNGAPVSKPEEVKAAVAGHAPGDKITLSIIPAKKDKKEDKKGSDDSKKPTDITVELAENPHQKNVAMLGVGMSTQSAGDTKVEYQLSGIGGPSAGLMMTLGVIDKLSPGDLTEGRHIAGTGTIDASGNVGEIGGITHKISAARDAGAEMFFVPSGNCSEALTADNGDMKLVKVSRLDDALGALENPDAAPTCS